MYIHTEAHRTICYSTNNGYHNNNNNNKYQQRNKTIVFGKFLGNVSLLHRERAIEEKERARDGESVDSGMEQSIVGESTQ